MTQQETKIEKVTNENYFLNLDFQIFAECDERPASIAECVVKIKDTENIIAGIRKFRVLLNFLLSPNCPFETYEIKEKYLAKHYKLNPQDEINQDGEEIETYNWDISNSPIAAAFWNVSDKTVDYIVNYSNFDGHNKTLHKIINLASESNIHLATENDKDLYGAGENKTTKYFKWSKYSTIRLQQWEEYHLQLVEDLKEHIKFLQQETEF